MQFSSEAYKGKSFEKSELDRRECLTAPLARRGRDLIGVVRLHNKIPQGTAPLPQRSRMTTRRDSMQSFKLPFLIWTCLLPNVGSHSL